MVPGQNDTVKGWDDVRASLESAGHAIDQALDHVGQMADVLARGEPVLPSASEATHLVGITTLPPGENIG